jgi:hypothetical protein
MLSGDALSGGEPGLVGGGSSEEIDPGFSASSPQALVLPGSSPMTTTRKFGVKLKRLSVM